MCKAFKHIKKQDYPYITGGFLEMNNGKKYTLEELEFIVKHFSVSLHLILSTQFLTPQFCKKYILDETYSITDSDRYITKEDVICEQPHISIKDLE